MCESLDSASAELAVDLAIERQRRQIESELAHARVGVAARRIPQIQMQGLVNVREASGGGVDTSGEDDLHNGSVHPAETTTVRAERPRGEPAQRSQIFTANVSFGEAF